MSKSLESLVGSPVQGGGRRTARRGGRRTARRGGRKTSRRGGRRGASRGGRRGQKRGGQFGVPAVLFLSQKAMQNAVHGKGKGKGKGKGRRTVLGRISNEFNKRI